MRKKFIAGNWKMNLDSRTAGSLVQDLKEKIAQGNFACCLDVAVCPSFVYLPAVVEILQGSQIKIGAQDVYFEGNGAYTGEISVAMLKDIGCQYVIVGHSERRHVLGETDEIVNKKLNAVLTGGLEGILCIGELLEERENNQTEAVIERHLRQGLAGITAEQMSRVTIAYEPVWAIGTGKTASPDQAQQAHAFARGILADIYDSNLADSVRIQYGGSVKAGNAADLMNQKDVDGALVGGASLDAETFSRIVRFND